MSATAHAMGITSPLTGNPAGVPANQLWGAVPGPAA